MNPFSLEHKIILVTGASSGIGAQIAITISEMGGKVILTGRNIQRLKETFSNLNGNNHTIIKADLTQQQDIEKLVNSIEKIDGIVHSAGIIKQFPIKFINQKHIEEIFSINYNAPVLLTSKLLKNEKIREKASCVFISSVLSQLANKGSATYSGTKAALNLYSKTVAVEYANKQIRSNVINAAMIDTPILNELESVFSDDIIDKHRQKYPLGFGTTQDIANGVIFLLSNASKWITGTELTLDGGLTIGE